MTRLNRGHIARQMSPTLRKQTVYPLARLAQKQCVDDNGVRPVSPPVKRVDRTRPFAGTIRTEANPAWVASGVFPPKRPFRGAI